MVAFTMIVADIHSTVRNVQNANIFITKAGIIVNKNACILSFLLTIKNIWIILLRNFGVISMERKMYDTYFSDGNVGPIYLCIQQGCGLWWDAM